MLVRGVAVRAITSRYGRFVVHCRRNQSIYSKSALAEEESFGSTAGPRPKPTLGLPLYWKAMRLLPAIPTLSVVNSRLRRQRRTVFDPVQPFVNVCISPFAAIGLVQYR